MDPVSGALTAIPKFDYAVQDKTSVGTAGVPNSDFKNVISNIANYTLTSTPVDVTKFTPSASVTKVADAPVDSVSISTSKGKVDVAGVTGGNSSTQILNVKNDDGKGLSFSLSNQLHSNTTSSAISALMDPNKYTCSSVV